MTITRTAGLETIGSLDIATIDGDGVTVAGWVAATDGTGIDDLTILWGNEAARPDPARTAAPDVQPGRHAAR